MFPRYLRERRPADLATPNKSRGQTMKTKDRLFAVGSAVVITGLVLLAHGQQADAAPRHDSTRQTCAAFRTWNHHRTAHNLDRMVRLSRHASPTVKTDVAVVSTEVRQDDWFDLPDDVHFLALDCRAARR